MISRRQIWLLAVMIVCLPAVAMSATKPTGLVLTPAFQTVQIKTNDGRLPFELSITNRDTSAQTFALSAIDFGSLDEEGGVAFLGAPASELEHKYGLAAWLELSQKSVVVSPGQTVKVGVTIVNRPSLVAGGHYGAVLATAQLPGSAVKGEQVGVQQVLSSLILAVKEGAGGAKLDLKKTNWHHSFWRLPTEFKLGFGNSGTVHALPRGTVVVTDPWGRKVAQGELNEASSVILPETNRNYEVAMRTVSQAWLPGRYMVSINYRDETQENFQAVHQTIWQAGAVVVWVAMVLAILSTAGLAWWLFGRRRKRRR